jgi:predicted lipoprotein with Yx(FWY)xxD motif
MGGSHRTGLVACTTLGFICDADGNGITMHPLPLILVSVAALTACSAFANQAATESTVGETASTVATPRTEATATPTPIPSTDRIPPIGDVSLEIDDRGDLGQIIVDGAGRAVYAFTTDPPNDPTCYDVCADTWLPVLAKGSPAGGVGIDTAAADTTPRRDGSNQVTYKGHPLYHYAGDKTDRDARGQGLDLFGGEWHVLAKDGQPLA